VKTETYTVLDCREFDKLVAEHLGFGYREDFRTWNDLGLDGWSGMQQDLMANQDTYVIFDNDPEQWEEWIQDMSEYDADTYDTRGGWGALTYKLAADLFRKNVFPPDNPVFVQVWW
jgi:hypothetical protein